MFKNKGLIISFTAFLLTLSLLLPTQAYYIKSKPITKGNNGYSCIYLLTFKHDSLLTFLKTADSEKGLYLIDLPFMKRNEDILKVLLEQNYAIGLISLSNEEQFDATILKHELQQFKEVVGSAPLWLTTSNGQFDSELLKTLHASSINAIAANMYFNASSIPTNIPMGSFVFIHANKTFNFETQNHLQLITSTQVRSIEENLFNMDTKNQDVP